MKQQFRAVAAAAAILLIVPDAARGQAADGHLVGTVLDQTGASIPGCSVIVENVNTGVQWNQKTDERGAYRFNNLPVGEYTLSAASEGFAPAMLSGIAVSLNRATTANISLELGEVQTAVEVTAASVQIDTTTATVGESFDARQALYSPSSDLALGVLNLSLQGAGVASSGGTGLGEGPSIGGQRPRNNNFMIEGVDNNDKGVTGRIVDVPNEAVAEFSLLQNQYGAEFGRSTGGQFNTVVKSGTNEIHGSLYEYFSNRHLNAIDESNKRRGILENPRLDDNRFGGTVGGPVIRNRLFYFGTFQLNLVGLASAPGRPFSSPTAEGFAALERIEGLSSTNLGVLQRYVPPAPAAERTTTVLGTEIPIGVLPINVPAYEDNRSWLVSADYTGKLGDQLRFLYLEQEHRRQHRRSLLNAAGSAPASGLPRHARRTRAIIPRPHASLHDDLGLRGAVVPQVATVVSQEPAGQLGAFRHVHGGVAAIRHGAERTRLQPQPGRSYGSGGGQSQRRRPHG